MRQHFKRLFVGLSILAIGMALAVGSAAKGKPGGEPGELRNFMVSFETDILTGDVPIEKEVSKNDQRINFQSVACCYKAHENEKHNELLTLQFAALDDPLANEAPGCFGDTNGKTASIGGYTQFFPIDKEPGRGQLNLFFHKDGNADVEHLLRIRGDLLQQPDGPFLADLAEEQSWILEADTFLIGNEKGKPKPCTTGGEMPMETRGTITLTRVK